VLLNGGADPCLDALEGSGAQSQSGRANNLIEEPTEKSLRMTYSFGANTPIQRIMITTTSGTQF
jgi:hypothetical protein